MLSHQYIEDTRESSDQGIDNHLHPVHLGHCSERSQSSQRPHGLEYRNISGAEQTCSKVDQGHSDDDEIEPAPGVAEVSDESHCKKFQGRFKEEDHSQNSVEIVEAINQHRTSVIPRMKQPTRLVKASFKIPLK